MLCSLSNLDEQNITEVKQLESDLGITILAFSCHDLETDAVDAETLTKIQAAENKLGLSLVAVKS